MTQTSPRLWRSVTGPPAVRSGADKQPRDGSEPAWLAQWLLATGVAPPGFRLDSWRRWDASLYLDIAQRGYTAAFFPLYPLGVRALTATGLGYLKAALLLSATARSSPRPT